ncbi:uncharacterized protein M6D78_012448 [Vipera latastei]
MRPPWEWRLETDATASYACASVWPGVRGNRRRGGPRDARPRATEPGSPVASLPARELRGHGEGGGRPPRRLLQAAEQAAQGREAPREQCAEAGRSGPGQDPHSAGATQLVKAGPQAPGLAAPPATPESRAGKLNLGSLVGERRNLTYLCFLRLQVLEEKRNTY